MSTPHESQPGPPSGENAGASQPYSSGSSSPGGPTGSPNPYGTPGPYSPSGSPRPSGAPAFWAWLRDLGVTRSSERWIGGVAGGVAARFNLDPLVVRGLFAASLLLGGIGFLLYGVAWALLPEPDGRIHAEQALRGHGDSAMVGIVLLVVAGIGPASWIGAPWADGGVWDGLKGVGWLVIAALVVYYLRQRRSGRGWAGGPGQRTSSSSSGATTTPAPPPPGTHPGPAGPLWGSASTASTSPAPTVQDLTTPYPEVGSEGTVHRSGSLPPLEPLPPLTGSGAAGSTTPAYATGATGASAPARPKPPIVRGPGTAMIAVVAALAILTVAALLLANRTGAVGGIGWGLTLGILVALIGSAIVVTGLRGRRSGVLTLFAIVGMLAASSAVSNSQGWDWDWEATQLVGEVDITPTSREEAAAAVSIGAGNATVDLTQVPLTAETLTVPVSVNAGQIEIVVPAGADVRADIDIFAGEVSWTVDGQDETASGRLTQPLTYSTDSVTDGAEPQLVLDISVGAGDITITEATS
ncbi:hypothetical protein C8046_06750 [Serinibacter arcticus]|uniref:Phage shock protein PspC N-terminal domain-containing protein n=1 Tax=Serinibacter arcticus TaxID=1655435 RepID=A0A2U1ZTX9_9MICO|nr:PspC domain-containing protein [Serinibacter arcticus]PWD50393.1 hypothetical protein C8046_06750 [Serinibacter arcticus]